MTNPKADRGDQTAPLLPPRSTPTCHAGGDPGLLLLGCWESGRAYVPRCREGPLGCGGFASPPARPVARRSPSLRPTTSAWGLRHAQVQLRPPLVRWGGGFGSTLRGWQHVHRVWSAGEACRPIRPWSAVTNKNVGDGFALSTCQMDDRQQTDNRQLTNSHIRAHAHLVASL